MSLGASGLRAHLMSGRAILLGKAGSIALAMTLAPIALGSSAAFAESSTDSRDQVQSEDTLGVDSEAVADASDDSLSDDAAAVDTTDDSSDSGDSSGDGGGDGGGGHGGGGGGGAD